MDVLAYLVALELHHLNVSADTFNRMGPKAQVEVFNTIRFSLKLKLRHYFEPEVLKSLDRKISDILFDRCEL
jgi:hypothetical protein